jgi:hypothetical protein
MIGFDLIDKDGPLLTAVPVQVSLPIAVDVEPPYQSPTPNWRFPNGGVDRFALPRDVAGQADVDRKQACHSLHSAPQSLQFDVNVTKVEASPPHLELVP